MHKIAEVTLKLTPEENKWHVAALDLVDAILDGDQQRKVECVRTISQLDPSAIHFHLASLTQSGKKP